MLTLDQTTVFYFSLRDAANNDKPGLVSDWVSRIQPNAKPSSKPSSTRNSASTPSQTHTSSRTCRSALSKDVKVTEDTEVASAAGGLFNPGETSGEEPREATIESLLKARRRTTSEVSHIFSRIYISQHR